MDKHFPKIIAVLGPTASGKSDLCVNLALWLSSKKYQRTIAGSEIISADSRQVYRGMNIGTGKITKKEMKGVPHHLLDVANPRQKFDVARYKTLAEKSINKILAQNKIPIICGGTGFYIQAIVDNISFPDVKPNEELRKKMEEYSLERLLKILSKLDPEKFKTIDAKNKRRIIRAIEIIKALGKIPALKPNPKYDTLQIGITKNREGLQRLIEKRLLKRLDQGMVNEVKKLRKNGVSWKRLGDLGLEYRFIALYLQKKITKQEMIDQLRIAIGQYAKRQITWFKRDERIIWLPPENTANKNLRDAKKIIERFLKNQ